ncbi:MAG: Na/Pi cotransporter family protein [Deltaproteobacteria bacterium]|nr:Na/Pi cotransporter family protein [Deltaproteobacteria bacterium]
MLRRLLFAAIVLILGWGMSASDEFQTVAAGVAIFLFGMLFLEQGFSAFTGGPLERVLGRFTSTLPGSLTFGVVSTSVMQSSSLVSVLTISFLSAGLIGLTEGVGIILGANIGTTTGAWLMAGFGMKVTISAYAMPMLVFGLFFSMQKRKGLSGFGYVLAGIGFLFLGIHYMKEGFEVLQASVDLMKYAMPGFTGLLVYAGLGAGATVVMQSSHATLMLIIAALAAGQIGYESALALAIGANVGTTVTAALGALGSNAAGRRLAAAHFVFNLVTGALAIACIGWFKSGVESISGWIGLAPDNWTLRLAVFHTLFNGVGVLVMLPFVGKLVRLLETRLEDPPPDAKTPLHLNEAALKLPATALEVLFREAEHLYDQVFRILAHGVGVKRGDILSQADLEAMLDFDPSLLTESVLDAYYQRVKTLYSAIVEFSGRAQGEMAPEQLDELVAIRRACRHLARAVKTMTSVMPNLEAHARGGDPAARAQYKELRLHIARTLRRLYAIKATEDPAQQFVAFQRLSRRAKRRDALSDEAMESLMRAGAISSAAATTLMNDWDAAREVVHLLRKAAQIVFVPRHSVLHSVADEMLTDASPHASYTDTLELERFVSDASLTGELRRIKGSKGG